MMFMRIVFYFFRSLMSLMIGRTQDLLVRLSFSSHATGACAYNKALAKVCASSRRSAYLYQQPFQIHNTQSHSHRTPIVHEAQVIIPKVDRSFRSQFYLHTFWKPSGKFSEYKTVKFGSGEGPIFVQCVQHTEIIFVTNERPSKPIPAIDIRLPRSGSQRTIGCIQAYVQISPYAISPLLNGPDQFLCFFFSDHTVV